MFQLLSICFALCVLLMLSVSECICEENDIIYSTVTTTNGAVRGQQVVTLFDSKLYHAFKGIPYAEPPVNKLRFKAPIPKKAWHNTLDTLQFGNKCAQKPPLFGGELIGKEDCLFLNVYTPDISPDTKLDVMVYIHGGRFMEGSGNDDFAGPDFLINENVVVVTLNYRLGVFGFLSLGSDEYSGNMGLKDQLLALKWVNENIHYFGGDKDKVTLFGHSAGAASIHIHMLTGASQGLFQRSILMSGTALHTWAVCDMNEHVLSMFALAKVIESPVYTLKDLIKFIQTLDFEKFMEHQDRIPYMLGEKGGDVNLFWAPIVESKTANEPFMVDTLNDLLTMKFNSNIDTMFGFNSMEWIFQMGGVSKNEEFLKHLEENFEPEIPHPSLNKKHKSYQQMTEDIRTHYFGKGGKISEKTVNGLGHLLSDVVFVYYTDQAVKVHAEKSTGKTFYYRFDVDAKYNAYKILYRGSEFTGASHGDEICYLFRCNINPKLYENADTESVELKTVRNLAKIWTNFAKFGNPTPDDKPVHAKPVNTSAVNFLNIQNKGVSAEINPNKESLEFWNKLIQKYSEPSFKGQTMERVEL